jgi:hypothetical protein
MKASARFLILALFAIVLNLAVTFSAEPETQEPSLSEVVFFGLPLQEKLKKSNRLKNCECLQDYLKSIPEGSILLSDDTAVGPETAIKYRRRILEEQIVVIMGEKTRDEAKNFSLAVPLHAEWEGMSENPINEADFVDNWLSGRPETPIAAFLHLFKAHRLRAGFECAKARHEKEIWPVLAVKYSQALRQAKSSENPLISCIAQDMEEQDFVYLENHGRP